jgi:hypothetical protein
MRLPGDFPDQPPWDLSVVLNALLSVDEDDPSCGC